MTASSSYMITNRNDPRSILAPQTPLPGSTLWWYMSPAGPNDGSYKDYVSQSTKASDTAPTSFIGAVEAELRAQKSPSLTIFIHGLDNDWSHSVSDTALIGANLAAQGYGGLVVGFSWPSMGALDLKDYSNGYPPAAKSGTARGNIALSVASFGSLIAFVNSVMNDVTELTVNFVCHSEGNYMLMLGLASQSGVALNQIVMLAADINDGALQTPASGLVGQGVNIATLSTAVTIYYSSNDTTLALSESSFSAGLLGAYHNSAYGGRLGLSGPSYNRGTQASNAYGVDCSAVVNSAYLAGLPSSVVPAGTSLHSSYLYIPQVLQDITATLGGTGPGDVANRTALLSAGSYFMTPAPPPPNPRLAR